MMSSLSFWNTLTAFTILFVCQAIFIVNFWSNRWFVANNIQGKGSTNYTLLIGFNSNCIESSHVTRPQCNSLSNNQDFLDNYVTYLYIGKILYNLIIISQLLMVIGIIGICRNFDNPQASASDMLFSTAAIVDFILKFVLYFLIIFGCGYEIGVTVYGENIYSTIGFAVVLFFASILMVFVVNILMVNSFMKIGKNFFVHKEKNKLEQQKNTSQKVFI